MVHHSNRKYPKPKANKKPVAPAISKKKIAASAVAAAAPAIIAPKKAIVKASVTKKSTKSKSDSIAASLAATAKADDFEALPSSDDEEEKTGFESTDDEEEQEEQEEEQTEEQEQTEELNEEGKTSQFENLKIPTPAEATTGTNDSSVIYVGRVPHGFYESQMRSYFSQFGTVVKLRLSRNKKTGKSKHFAFLEFSSPDVAQIVADTMDNYLLFGHILKCKVVPKDKIHQDLFVGANKTFRAIPWGKIAKHKNDSPKSQAQWEKLTKKSLDKSVAKKEALAELGIKYSMK